MKLYNLKTISPILIGFVLWILGSPAGLNEEAFLMSIIFISTILSILIRTLPMAMSVLIGLFVTIATDIMPLKKALLGFSDTTTWLVVIAFLIAGVIIDTGLGKRVALICIDRVGKTIIGLGYALCSAELLLGPFVPSNTARGGGIIAPLADSISRSLGSSPEEKPESAGEYLHLVGAHANLITAAMFLTGMAANPLIARAALDIYGIEFDWVTWALGAIVPGVVGLLGLPIFLKYLSPPTIGSMKPMRKEIKTQIEKLGAWSFHEKGAIFILAFMLLLWVTKSLHGLGTTVVALLGLISILLFKVSNWERLVKNHRAWDTLVWLGGLLTLATGLKDTGFIPWLSDIMNSRLVSLESFTLLIVLLLIYFYSMYAFSMLTAHIAALASTIFILASETNINPYLIVALIAYFSSLCGCLTNYSTGPIIIYFGNGYSKPSKWFKVGLLVSFYHLVIWFIVGSAWWKFIGWY